MGQQGELLTKRSLALRGFEVTDDVKIVGKAGDGRMDHGIDIAARRQNVVSTDRTLVVESKPASSPRLKVHRGIEQGSSSFNETRLRRAMNPSLSSEKTIAAAEKLDDTRLAGQLESYKSEYDLEEGVVKFYRLVTDPANSRRVISQVKDWLLW